MRTPYQWSQWPKSDSPLARVDTFSLEAFAQNIQEELLSEKGPLYFLDTDGDCHWHIVRADKRKEWEAWVALDKEIPENCKCPDFANPIQGCCNSVEFYFINDK